MNEIGKHWIADPPRGWAQGWPEPGEFFRANPLPLPPFPTWNALLPSVGAIIEALEAKKKMNLKPSPERESAARASNAVVVLVEFYTKTIEQAHGENDSLRLALEAQGQQLTKLTADLNQREGVIAQQRTDKAKIQSELDTERAKHADTNLKLQRIEESERRSDYVTMQRTLEENKALIQKLQNTRDIDQMVRIVSERDTAERNEKKWRDECTRETERIKKLEREKAALEKVEAEANDLRQQIADARARALAAEARLAIRDRKATARKKA